MVWNRKWARIGAAVILAAGAGVGVLAAASSDNESPLAGEARQRASEAALAHTGGGTVSEAEVGDGGSSYEVEVTLEDGSQVEVNLDANFNVVTSGSDDDGSGGDD